MRRLMVGMAVLLLLGACESDDPAPQAQPTPEETSTPTTEPTTSPSPDPSPQERGGPKLRVLGHEDFDGNGFNGDVWALGDFAYVGTYGGKTEDADCPQAGVKVVDISDPTNPQMVGRLTTEPGTTAEDVVARNMKAFGKVRDVAAVGLQACNIDEDIQADTVRGLQFFDVTDPRKPKDLGTWSLPADAPGCHEIDLVAAKGRSLAGCASPFGKEFEIDEAYVVDLEGKQPRTVFGWSLDEGPGGGVGCLPAQIVHNVRFSDSGMRAYLSYWDAGTVVLDIRNLDDPRLLSRIEPTPLDPDGDNHSVAEISKDRVMVLHEDFSPASEAADFGGCGSKFGAWGPLRIYDISKPGKPKLLSEFATDNMKISKMKTPEIFSVHNAEVAGDDAFVSWYSDGVRWLDVSDPKNPREIDAWVPKAARDPHGFMPKVPLVWGVYPHGDVLLATDINSGLWVLRAEGSGAE